MEEITIGEKTYISSKRAAEITGYAKDYVGQLCREGHVEAKMVGRSWYVLEASIREHRFGKTEKPESFPTTFPVSLEESGTQEAVEAGDTQSAAERVSALSEPEMRPERTSWAAPRYVTEPDQPIPTLDPAVQRSSFVRLEPESGKEAASLTDMQSAWREWFEQRQQGVQVPPRTVDRTPTYQNKSVWEETFEDEELTQEQLPEPAIEDEVADYMQDDQTEDEGELQQASYVDEEQPIPIHRVRTDQIPLAEEPEPEARVLHERVIQYRKPTRSRATDRKKGTRWVTGLALLITGLAFLGVGVLASGIADGYLLTKGLVNPIPPYLVGESIVK